MIKWQKARESTDRITDTKTLFLLQTIILQRKKKGNAN